MLLKTGIVLSFLCAALCSCGRSEEVQEQSLSSLVQYCSKKNKTCICHVPPGNPKKKHEICMSSSALEAHWSHGGHSEDYLGHCDRCGDHVCGRTENCTNCCEDCGQCQPPPPVCGDHSCNGNEGCENCSQDCGQCPPTCGDERCEDSESCESCEPDCGKCEVPIEPDAGVVVKPDCQVVGIVDSGVVSKPDVYVHNVQPDANVQPDVELYNRVDAGTQSQPDVGQKPDVKEEVKQSKNSFAGGCSMNGNENMTGSGGLTLIILALLLYFSRKRTVIATTVFAAIVFVFSASIYAFPTTQNFRPTPGTSDYFVTQDGRLSKTSPSLLYQFERNPVTLISKPDNKTLFNILDQRHTLHLLFATSFWDRVQFGLDLPVVLDQSAGNLNPVGLTHVDGGMGDLRLLTKIRLLTVDTFNLAVGIDWAVPTSTVELLGEKYGSVIPSLIGSISLGPVDLAANLGFRLRGDESFSAPNIVSQGGGQLFVGSLGARWNFWSNNDVKLALVSDAQVSTTLTSIRQEEIPFEWFNGIQSKLPEGFGVNVGASVGFTRGMGNPMPRAFIGLSWTWEKPVVVVCKNPKEIVRWRSRDVNKFIPVPVEVPVPVIVSLPSVFFDTDKSTLRPEATKELDRVVELLQMYPQIKTLRVEGHTDHRASVQYNQALSERRVQAVIDYLKSKGVVTELEGQGFSELAPVDKTDTEDGMQRNRRVDLRVVRIER